MPRRVTIVHGHPGLGSTEPSAEPLRARSSRGLLRQDRSQRAEPLGTIIVEFFCPILLKCRVLLYIT
jgi:hypothetical protein